jgi:hypothetical protein
MSKAISELNTQLTLWQGVRSSLWVMLRYYNKTKMFNEKQYMARNSKWHDANEECKRLEKSLEVI